MTLSYNDLIGQNVEPEFKFFFKTVDETVFLSNAPYIRRSVGQVSIGSIQVEVDNADQSWNTLKASKKDNLGKSGEYKLFIDVPPLDSLVIFTGSLESVEYKNTRVFLTFRDKLSTTIKKRLGNGQSPVKYYPATWTLENPADIVWDILTVHGGLDSTQSSANVDIDYDAWVLWKSFMTTVQYKIRAEFKGDNIQSALKLIGSLTNSTFFSSGDGRIVSRFFIGANLAAVNAYTTDETDGIPEDKFDRRDIINKYIVFHGFDPSLDTFAGSVTIEDATSQTDFGLFDETFDSKKVWHSTSISATDWAIRELDETNEPIERIEFDTFLHGFGEDPANGITLTDPLLDFTAIGMRIEDLTLRGKEGTSIIAGRKIDLFDFFILDDSINGELDSSFGLI